MGIRTGFLAGSLGILSCVLLASCESVSAPDDLRVAFSAHNGTGNQSLVTGSYIANIAVPPGVIIAEYNIGGRVDKDGVASGSFTFFADTPQGTIEFDATIICLPVDETLKRAWVGGVITRNGSTRPTHQLAIHAVGEPIWFRVADRGNGGSGDADRTTSLGFRGALNVQTSEEYCALRPWGNDGIGILSGNLSTH